MSRPQSNLDKAAALKEATAQRDRAVQRLLEEEETDARIEEQMGKLTAAVTDIVDNIRESEDRLAVSQAPGNEAIVLQPDRVRGVLASLGARRDNTEGLEEQEIEKLESEPTQNLEEFMSWAIATCNESNTRQFNCKTFPQRQQGRIIIAVGDDDIHLEGIFEEDTASWTDKLGDLIVLPVPGARIAVLLDCDQIFVMDEVFLIFSSKNPLIDSITFWASIKPVQTTQSP